MQEARLITYLRLQDRPIRHRITKVPSTEGREKTDDETDNVATGMGELCRPPGPPIGTSHRTETSTPGHVTHTVCENPQ